MATPTRRDFFTYAAGATLASALPVSAQTHKDKSLLPLVVDLIGPMAFTMGKDVDVWLPKLTQDHEAGIGTSVSSTVLSTEGKYAITGPMPFSGPPPPPPNIDHLVSGDTIYTETVKNDGNFAKTRFIQLTLPMPHHISVLNPVMARIYPTGQNSTAACTPYAVGLRFKYDQTGVPTLTPSVNNVGIIPLAVTPSDTQVNMSIGYAPFDSTDDSQDTNARKAFNELSKLLKLDLSVQIESAGWHCSANQTKEGSSLRGPLHNCHAPNILVHLV